MIIPRIHIHIYIHSGTYVIIPIVIVTLGTIPKSVKRHLEDIGLKKT